MREGLPDSICANPVLATCCGGSVPGRLKTGARFSSQDWECLSSECSMNYCVCVFTQDVQGQNSIQVISNRQEKFLRNKLAIFHDTLTLPYSRIQLSSLFLKIYMYWLAVAGWIILQISVQGMWEVLRKPRELILCPVFPQVLRPFSCHLVSVVFYFLLQGIFPTQGLNQCLPHCRYTLYCLSHREGPK